jgi:Uma2 family endonuclease
MVEALQKSEQKYMRPMTVVEPKRVPFKVFYHKYIDPGNSAEPGIKYEYNNGIVEKIQKMKYREKYIVKNLTRRFIKTQAHANGHELTEETEIFTSPSQMRKPDLCFLTAEQIIAAVHGKESPPDFVIEIISTHDPVNDVTDKILEYLNAGVKVIWHIFPKQKVVYIYKSYTDIKILKSDSICSAEPILPDYQISVDDIFFID